MICGSTWKNELNAKSAKQKFFFFVIYNYKRLFSSGIGRNLTKFTQNGTKGGERLAFWFNNVSLAFVPSVVHRSSNGPFGIFDAGSAVCWWVSFFDD